MPLLFIYIIYLLEMKSINEYINESSASKVVIYEINGDEISSLKYVNGMNEDECIENCVHKYNSLDELVDAINSKKCDTFNNLLKVIHK